MTSTRPAQRKLSPGGDVSVLFVRQRLELLEVDAAAPEVGETEDIRALNRRRNPRQLHNTQQYTDIRNAVLTHNDT